VLYEKVESSIFSSLYSLLGAALLGCANAGMGNPKMDPEDKKTESDPGAGDNTNPSKPGGGGNETVQIQAIQTMLDKAVDGEIVTLNTDKVPAGSSITINKALTINGNGVDGLTVKVSSEVKNNVILKNLKM